MKPSLSRQQLNAMMYEAMFPALLDGISMGRPLKKCLGEDIRDCDKAAFLRWVFSDSSRKARYYEAQEIAAEMLSSDILQIADGESQTEGGFEEDTQRSKVKIETRRYLMGIYNKKRFQETKQIELKEDINIKDALGSSVKRLGDAVIDIGYSTDEEE